ncbi:hypothetical protein F511_13883 [Dorcoceras hygrometricum]|uniref:Uncharacterized protein n=1 Tax=Dorcoceras hygrometricum TaxID=472368 RepID=A0A2Z7CCS1_9LAMI|nr:hypothetical protein F511_13883 [Dorcoceras hygrometricum]
MAPLAEAPPGLTDLPEKSTMVTTRPKQPKGERKEVGPQYGKHNQYSNGVRKKYATCNAMHARVQSNRVHKSSEVNQKLPIAHHDSEGSHIVKDSGATWACSTESQSPALYQVTTNEGACDNSRCVLSGTQSTETSTSRIRLPEPKHNLAEKCYKSNAETSRRLLYPVTTVLQNDRTGIYTLSSLGMQISTHNTTSSRTPRSSLAYRQFSHTDSSRTQISSHTQIRDSSDDELHVRRFVYSYFYAQVTPVVNPKEVQAEEVHRNVDPVQADSAEGVLIDPVEELSADQVEEAQEDLAEESHANPVKGAQDDPS